MRTELKQVRILKYLTNVCRTCLGLLARANLSTWAKPAEITEAIQANGADNFVSNTILTNTESFGHSMSETLPVGSVWAAPKPGYTHGINNMDLILWPYIGNLTNASSKYETVVFDRNNAMLTARKRWLQIDELYDAPTDIADMTVSFRQDSISLYKDSITLIAETYAFPNPLYSSPSFFFCPIKIQ